ncbi:MAG: nucleotidyltransferase family protein [Candidatus Omnitrophota bacterium]|nr:MAG: nucleotidyltransferase family protein [Candidatus Omnitrophota bacterium]
MVAIILAAGYGTRLYPLTLDKPKAFLEVGGKTILDRLVAKIKLIKECKEIIVVTNEKFYKNFKAWKAQSAGVEVINDGTKSNKTRLGAIGDINLVLQKKSAKQDLLIAGSDNLFEFDLREFIRFARKKRPFSSIALFDIKDRKLARKYGVCSLDKNARVIEFEEKPPAPKSTLAASALYFIPKEKITKISDYMKTGLPKDAPGNLMKWLAKTDKVFGYVLPGAWYDIGDMKSLKKADEDFK